MKKKTQQKQDGSQTGHRGAAKSKPQTATGTPKAALASPEILAMIAATLAKGGVEKPATAIANAAALYDAACAHLESKARYLSAKQAKAEEMASLPRPKNFPAGFDDVLKVIVCAKTPADGTKRFRDYLRDSLKHHLSSNHARLYPSWAQPAAKKRLDEMVSRKAKAKQLRDAIDEQAKHGIGTHKNGILEEAWFELVKDYRSWWNRHKSDQARAAAKSKNSS